MNKNSKCLINLCKVHEVICTRGTPGTSMFFLVLGRLELQLFLEEDLEDYDSDDSDEPEMTNVMRVV